MSQPGKLLVDLPIEAPEPTTGDRFREYAAARVAEYAVALRAASAARQQALGDEDIRALLVQFQAALIRNLR
jgi:hypothetical protein